MNSYHTMQSIGCLFFKNGNNKESKRKPTQETNCYEMHTPGKLQIPHFIKGLDLQQD